MSYLIFVCALFVGMSCCAGGDSMDEVSEKGEPAPKVARTLDVGTVLPENWGRLWAQAEKEKENLRAAVQSNFCLESVNTGVGKLSSIPPSFLFFRRYLKKNCGTLFNLGVLPGMLKGLPQEAVAQDDQGIILQGAHDVYGWLLGQQSLEKSQARWLLHLGTLKQEMEGLLTRYVEKAEQAIRAPLVTRLQDVQKESGFFEGPLPPAPLELGEKDAYVDGKEEEGGLVDRSVHPPLPAYPPLPEEWRGEDPGIDWDHLSLAQELGAVGPFG